MALTIELLPELGAFRQIHVRRVRATYSINGAHKRGLGTGISTSSAMARAKAISEALERLTLAENGEAKFRKWAHVVNGSLGALSISDSTTPSLESANGAISAAACHPLKAMAIENALIEAEERKHLWEWCDRSNRGEGISVCELDLAEAQLPLEILNCFRAVGLRIFVTWCDQPLQFLPAYVCLAVRTDGACFYASSAAGRSQSLALEHALYDVAKLLVVEEAFPGRTAGFDFRHRTEDVPSWLERQAFGVSPEAWRNRGWARQTFAQRLIYEHEAPWLALMDHHVISVPLSNSRPAHPSAEWFR